MFTSEPNEGGDAALLRHDDPDTTPESHVGGGGDAGAHPPRPRRHLPTLACIVLPTLLTLVAAFVAAILLPAAPAHAAPPTSPGNVSNGSRPEKDARDDGPFVRSHTHNSPRGIHLGLTGTASEMFVQFATGGSGKSLVEIAAKGDAAGGAVLAAGRRLDAAPVEGTSTTYAAADMCDAPATSTDPGYFVSPGNLHTVKVTGLAPDTEYEYRAGLGFGQGTQWSPYFTFRTAPAPGAAPADGEPVITFLAFADQGCPDSQRDRGLAAHATPAAPAPAVHPASAVTTLVAALVAARPVHAVHVVGGLSLADGVAHLWDDWADLLQEYAAAVPVVVGVGNHEYDHVRGGAGKDPSGVATDGGFLPSWGAGVFDAPGGGECGVPVARRFAAPAGGNGIFWYSYDQPLVHTVMLSSEHNLTFNSTQYVWLERDLAAVNRTATPWLVVEMHRPLYNSELGGYWLNLIVGEGLQNEVEDLFRAYHVDLVISGHYRSYFRSCAGLYAGACDARGPTYVTVGTGGAPLDAPGPAPLVPGPARYTAFADRARHGVGRASVFNATALCWEFVAVGGNVTDAVWLTREPERRS